MTTLTCQYTKHEVEKKKDTTAITLAKENCVGWLSENCYSIRDD